MDNKNAIITLIEEKGERKTYCLITTMQQAFLQHEIILLTQGVDLRNTEERKAYHSQKLKDILEIEQ